jgi:hypothetical protein
VQQRAVGDGDLGAASGVGEVQDLPATQMMPAIQMLAILMLTGMREKRMRAVQ